MHGGICFGAIWIMDIRFGRLSTTEQLNKQTYNYYNYVFRNLLTRIVRETLTTHTSGHLVWVRVNVEVRVEGALTMSRSVTESNSSLN